MWIAGNEPDIMMVNEVIPKAQTHPIPLALLSIPGYTMYANFDPSEGKLGRSGLRGICMYVKSSLNVTETSFDGSVFKEQLWLRMALPSSDSLLLGCLYRSPSGNAEEDVREIGKLFSLAVNSGHSHIIITGDFNLPQIDWGLGLSTAPLSHCSHAFVDIVNDCFLHQHVDQPTRFRTGETPHMLDLVLSNEEGMVKNLELLPGLGTSDHVMIQFQLACYSPAIDHAIPRLNLNKGNFKLLNQRLASVNWAASANMDTETMYTFIKETLTTQSCACIPQGKPRSTNRNLYINREALRLKKLKRTLWFKYMHSRDALDHARFTRARNKLRTLTRNLRSKFERDLVNHIKDNPKGFWRYAGSRLRTKTRVEDLRADDGTVAHEDHEKANLLNSYFHSVFTTENPCLPSMPSTYEGPSLNDVDVSPAAVGERLLRLKSDSAPGPDGLHPRILRETAPVMSGPWAQLFRSSLDSGRLPKDWSMDEITPLHKKGPKQCPGNYRPVTLTAVPCKVLESLIRDHGSSLPDKSAEGRRGHAAPSS